MFSWPSKNLVALVAIQASSAIMPILVIPYTLVVVGPENFANIALAETIAMVVVAIVLYSFEVDGVRQIVGVDRVRDSKQLSEIYSSILSVRLLLFALAAPVAVIFAWCINPELLPLLGIWLLLPLSYAFQPSWLCQGLEDNVALAVSMVAARLATVFVLFLYLDEKNFYLVPLVVAGMLFVGSIVSMVFATNKHGIRFKIVSVPKLIELIAAGRSLFAANFSVIFYRDINVLILGVCGSSSEAIASYAFAEKIVKMVQAAIRPINQYYLPRAMRMIADITDPSCRVCSKLLKLTYPQLLVVTLIVFAGWASIFFVDYESLAVKGGVIYRDIVPLVAIMSLAVFAGVVNYMLGMIGLSGLGASKYFLGAVFCVALVNLLITSIAVSYFDELGAAISFVFAEVVLFVLIIAKYVWRRRQC